MPHNKVGFTLRLLTLLLLVVVQGGHATPTTPTAAPVVAQVIGATSLAATRAAVYAATDNRDDDGDGDDNKRNQLEDLMPANLLLEDLQQPNGQLINLTRHHDGDIFYTNGEYTYTYTYVEYPQSLNPQISNQGGFLTPMATPPRLFTLFHLQISQ